jgi:hypothetical protein
MTALFPSLAGKEGWAKAKVAHNGNCIIGNAVPCGLSGAAQLTGTVHYKCRNYRYVYCTKANQASALVGTQLLSAVHKRIAPPLRLRAVEKCGGNVGAYSSAFPDLSRGKKSYA